MSSITIWQLGVAFVWGFFGGLPLLFAHWNERATMWEDKAFGFVLTFSAQIGFAVACYMAGCKS